MALTDDNAEQVAMAERLVGRLVADSAWLAPEYRRASADRYMRYPIYRDPRARFEVIVLVWQPGQGTALHDHDGTWGAEGVLCGRMQVTNFEQTGSLEDGRVRLRNLGTLLINAQETGQLLPPADCHIVANAGEETAMTIHVYGKPLQRFRVFERDAEEDLYHVREQRV